jgi:hypothetical protein
MKQLNVHQLFHAVTVKLVNEMGNHALNTSELNNMGKHLFKARYLGAVPQDRVNFSKSGYLIVNTDTAKGKGIHWVAVVITPKTVYVYDSFGRNTTKLLRHFTAKARTKKLRIVDSKRDAEQKDNTAICGHMCLAWLSVVKLRGIRQALKI